MQESGGASGHYASLLPRLSDGAIVSLDKRRQRPLCLPPPALPTAGPPPARSRPAAGPATLPEAGPAGAPYASSSRGMRRRGGEGERV